MNILDQRASFAKVSVRQSVAEVSRLTGKSAAAQLSEIVRLYRGPGQLAPREYFYFGLYDDRFSSVEKKQFVGLELQNHILLTCTKKQWWALSQDKLACYAMMEAYGFPVPRVVATLHPFRRLPAAKPLRNTEEVAVFLRSQATYPLFGKPFDGRLSVGCARVDAYDASTDELVVHPQRRVAVSLFLQSISRYVDRGYLFQEVLHPHATVHSLCGDRLASVRFVLLVGERGPEPFRAVWKFPAGPHVADNYWRKGNLLAGIDIETGRVSQVMTGTGTARVKVSHHPDTGASLDDLTVPDWQALKELCLSAATTMPGVTIQGWDVAPSANGPVLIEVNIGGDFTLPQLGNDRGMLDDQFRAYLSRHKFVPRSLPRRLAGYISTNVRRLAAAGTRRTQRVPQRAPSGG